MRSRVALWLGATSALDYVAQLLLPALLVRVLAPADFGGYRLLWMTAQTSALLLSLNMGFNLVYLAPRHGAQQRGALLGNALACLAVAGLLAACVVQPLLHAVAGTSLDSRLPAWALPAFVCAWMVSLPVDHLGLMAGRPGIQAGFTLAQTAMRILLIGGAAWVSRDLAGLALGMIGLALFRLVLVFGFARTAAAPLRLDAGLAAAQVRYGIGFGLGASLFALRGQLDGWITAALFDPVAVATMSIALAIVPVIGVVRQAYTSASVSEVARRIATGQVDAALQLNRDTNLASAMVLFPLIGGFVTVATDAISLVYTPAYAAAAAPARLYAFAYAVCALETSTVVQALGNARFVSFTSAALLVVGGLGTAVGAWLWGLPGVALGSLAAMWLGSAWNLHHVARHCGRGVGTLQPWGPVALLAGIAAAAALLCGSALAATAHGSHLQRMLLGGIAFLAVYAALAGLIGPARRLYARWLPRPAAAVTGPTATSS